MQHGKQRKTSFSPPPWAFHFRIDYLFHGALPDRRAAAWKLFLSAELFSEACNISLSICSLVASLVGEQDFMCQERFLLPFHVICSDSPWTKGRAFIFKFSLFTISRRITCLRVCRLCCLELILLIFAFPRFDLI